MPPSSKAPQPTRHSMLYPTSPPTTLSLNLLSSSGFTQPFAPFSPRPPGAWQVPLTPSGPPPLGNPLLSLPSNSASLRHRNLSSIFYTLRDSTMPSPSSLFPSSMLFSPLSFFYSQKANDQLSMQITPFPLAYPKPTRQPPYSPTAPLPSISAKVHLLTETIQSLEALLKERTLTPPLFQLSYPPQSFHPPLLLYHQADLHLPDPLLFPTSYTNEVPSRLASIPTTSNICSTLGATPKRHPPPPANSVEPIPIPAPTSSITGMDDHPHSP